MSMSAKPTTNPIQDDKALDKHTPCVLAVPRDEGILKFTADYDELVRPTAGISVFGSAGIWSQFFGRIPVVGPFFRWYPAPVRRDSEPPDLVMLKPGIFTLRVLIDTVFLFWLGYLDAAPPEGDDFDPRESCNNEYTNCGILSALLLTVWVNFMTTSDSLPHENAQLKEAYNVIWTTAFILVLLATLQSVLMLLMISEAGGRKEAIHFLNSLDKATRGFGSHSPVILLYLSLIFAAGGIMMWIFISFGATSNEVMATLSIAGLMFICFAVFVLHGVSALYLARHTQAKVQCDHPFHIKTEQIKKDLDEFSNLVGGFENISSVDKFLTFFETKPRGGDNNYKRKLTDTTIEIAKEIYRQQLKNKVKAELAKW